MERRKFELQINHPTEIELLFDEPIMGKSQFGEYYLYAIKSGDQEYSYFAPDEVHSELKKMKKADSAVITKLVAQRDRRLVTTYDVVCKSVRQNEPVSIQEVHSAKEASKIEVSSSADNYFDIMLTSYKDALQIQEKLGTMIDTTKISICLFIARTH